MRETQSWCFTVFMITNLYNKSFVRQTKNHLEELFQVQTVSEERDCLKSCWYRSWQNEYALQNKYQFLIKGRLEV